MTKDEKQLIDAELKWEKQREIQKRKYQLKKEKTELKNSYKNKVSTSKLLVLFLFINCTLIELFTGYVTIKSFDLAVYTAVNPDFTPLVTLIGAVVSEVIGFAVYALKSAKENSANGIIYETTMAKIREQEAQNEISASG